MLAGSPHGPAQRVASPGTVPSGRCSRLAIGRWPAPSAARRSAWPITCALSRRRGTSHDGQSTCVVLHKAHRARRGRTGRASVSVRTSRERAKPHADNGPEHTGQASSPAAKAASTHSGVIAIESIKYLWVAHRRRTLPERVTAGKGRLVLHTYHSDHARSAWTTPTPTSTRPRRADRERREGGVSCRNRTASNRGSPKAAAPLPTEIREARPRGFEPLTFGSVAGSRGPDKVPGNAGKAYVYQAFPLNRGRPPRPATDRLGPRPRGPSRGPDHRI